jgi:putative DNA primase/helicase
VAPVASTIGPVNRPRLVAAALTLLRAYVVAGRPEPVRRVPSFEAWSALVPSALVWAGEADATKAIPEESADEATETTNALITAWPEGKTFTAAQLLATMQGAQVDGVLFADNGAFRAALTDFVWDEFPSTRGIGRKMATVKGVTFDGKRLAFQEKSKLWAVAPAKIRSAA